MSLNLKHMTANIYEYESHFYSGTHTSVYQKYIFFYKNVYKYEYQQLHCPCRLLESSPPPREPSTCPFCEAINLWSIIKHGRTNCHGTHPLRSTLKSRTSASPLSIHINHRVPYATPRTETSITASSQGTRGRCEGGCRAD